MNSGIFNSESKSKAARIAGRSRPMRDSGVAWIGEVPALWNVERLQWHCEEINVKNDPVQTENILSLTNDRGVIPYAEKGNQGNKAKENYSEYKVAFENTIIANSMNILIGSVGLSKYYGCVSPVYYIFKAKDNADIHFLDYLFQMRQFQRELRKYANGILEIRLRVSADDILKRKIAFPPLLEQRAIAAYLDQECGKIDGLRAKIEQQIEKLGEYKKSLITEAVTKGTRKKKLKYITTQSITYGIIKLGDPDELGVKVLRCSDVQPGFIDCSSVRTVLKSLSDEFSRTVLKGGEVVINVRGSLGGCAVVSNDMVGWNVAREVAVIALDNSIVSSRYIMYSLLSGDFEQYLKENLSGAVYVGMNMETLGNYPTFCPSLAEQREIAAYLDEKCGAIDAMVEKCRGELEKLAEYKKSLIFECVTGKREVSAYEPLHNGK